MSEGKKDDIGKLRMDLIPVIPLEKLAEVYTIGCKKYADRNWEKGIAWSRCYGAMLRHLVKFWKGESIDTQDGQHHLAAVVFYAFAMMEYETTHPELDDRPKTEKPPVREAVTFDIVPYYQQRWNRDKMYTTVSTPDSTGHS